MLTTQKPQRKPDYQMETIDGELLLFHPDQQKIFYCNESAALIWQLCDGQHTVAEIVALLREAYPEAAEEIEKDVQVTLQALHEHGALTFE
jgi:coenzyme PQQ biosynthesis protein PqqD